MRGNYKTYVCDFETTVYAGQEYTEVWAAACVEMYTEDVHIFHSIADQLEFFADQKCNIVAYYHNLKFDGSFWIDYLLRVRKLRQACEKHGNGMSNVKWNKNSRMPYNSFKYSISDRGQWYTITIKYKGKIIELRDSLKLLPFSVKRIGKAFKTKHQKLEMEYEGYRFAGCVITDEEQEYIANDVLVIKEALEIMYDEGHSKLTIGSCCLDEYKNICQKSMKFELRYDEMFPDLYEKPIDEKYGALTAGEYIRKSYRGGWCYVVRGKELKLYGNGTTADVNSLYPSMMSSESGNRYPIGYPRFWSGNMIPDEALFPNRFFFIRIKTRFYLKPGKLPFIQIKNNLLYKGNECLESSDVYDAKTGKYYTHYVDSQGELHDTRVELTMTMTDYRLFLDQYELVDFEILDGCWFHSLRGIFDEYIDKYKKIKQESTGALRELAKLFLNNLYGKMASSTDSSFKFAFIKDDNSIGFYPVLEHDKKPGYIPVGSAITSYARNFTIRAAQANYYGVDKPGFIYADTDSIHCDLAPEDIKGIKVDEKEFCCWKLESCWDKAIFTRQKTYIEHVIMEDLQVIDEPYDNVKCAGMPDTCKDLLIKSFQGDAVYDETKYSKDELKFLFDDNKQPIKRTYFDFREGLRIPDKLMPKRIPGGTLLVNTTYEMK